jgi:hypothetical protein
MKQDKYFKKYNYKCSKIADSLIKIYSKFNLILELKFELMSFKIKFLIKIEKINFFFRF